MNKLPGIHRFLRLFPGHTWSAGPSRRYPLCAGWRTWSRRCRWWSRWSGCASRGVEPRISGWIKQWTFSTNSFHESSSSASNVCSDFRSIDVKLNQCSSRQSLKCWFRNGFEKLKCRVNVAGSLNKFREPKHRRRIWRESLNRWEWIKKNYTLQLVHAQQRPLSWRNEMKNLFNWIYQIRATFWLMWYLKLKCFGIWHFWN